MANQTQTSSSKVLQVEDVKQVVQNDETIDVTNVMEKLKNLAQVLKQALEASKGTESRVTFVMIIAKYQTLINNLLVLIDTFNQQSKSAVNFLQLINKLAGKLNIDGIIKMINGFNDPRKIMIEDSNKLTEECKNLQSKTKMALKDVPNEFKKYLKDIEGALRELKMLLDGASLYLPQIESFQENEQISMLQSEEIIIKIQNAENIWQEFIEKNKKTSEKIHEVKNAVDAVMNNL